MNIIKGTAGVVVFFGLVALQPFVLVVLNEWHLKHIAGTPSITWVQAYVIGMVFSLFNYQHMLKVEQKSIWEIFGNSFVKYGLILAIAWLLTFV